MANLMQKTKFVNICVRKTDFAISERDRYIHKWCDENCEYYAYIYHKQDHNLEHILEHEHVHLVLTLKNSQRLSTTLNSFCEAVTITTLGVEIQKQDSLEGSLQYLLHKNDPQKDPHEFKEIITNYDEGDLKVLLEAEFNNLTPERLRELVRKSSTNYELVKALGIERYIRYRKLISDLRDDFRIWNY